MNDLSMNWYKSLPIQKRITLKELCKLICGVDFHILISLFGMKDTIGLIHQKLELEGFDVSAKTTTREHV